MLPPRETPATTEAGLCGFLEGNVMPSFETRRKELANCALIREQAFGEALDPLRLRLADLGIAKSGHNADTDAHSKAAYCFGEVKW